MTNTTRTVTLASPIARKGADPITEVAIARPTTGALARITAYLERAR